LSGNMQPDCFERTSGDESKVDRHCISVYFPAPGWPVYFTPYPEIHLHC
jgi:hypothetical protein